MCRNAFYKKQSLSARGSLYSVYRGNFALLVLQIAKPRSYVLEVQQKGLGCYCKGQQVLVLGLRLFFLIPSSRASFGVSAL